MQPQFPVYIVSKGRAEIATTPGVLDEIGVPCRIVVEEFESDAYARSFGRDRILVLDPAYQRDYDSLDDLGDTKSRGPGPARNFAWEHAIAGGHRWHWVMDDNIRLFARLHRNRRVRVGDGTILAAMEDFATRYKNVGMAGPHYWMFRSSRSEWKPFEIGSRIYSCNLIRNDLRFRWRGRWNEDTILSLDLLTAGWMTVLFNAFLQWKTPTQQMAGGCTDDFYRDEGTYEKSRMLALTYPQYARIVRRYGRWHHHVDYSRWRKGPLLPRDDYQPSPSNRYAMSREIPR